MGYWLMTFLSVLSLNGCERGSSSLKVSLGLGGFLMSLLKSSSGGLSLNLILGVLGEGEERESRADGCVRFRVSLGFFFCFFFSGPVE